MKYRRIFAASAALALAASAFSCGKGGNTAETNTSTEETTVSLTAENSKTESKSENSSKKTAVSTSDKSKKTTTTATTTKSNGKLPQSTAASGKSGSSATTAAQNNSQGSNADNDGNTAAEPETDEKLYTAEIVLGASPSVKGSNVSTNGSVVTIKGGGDFLFSGSVTDGQICVDTAVEEKVTIVLNGVDISNSNGPAIFISEAKKCTIKSREGTANYLSDGGKDKVNNGVIFSNDTVRLKGNGELNITANNAHGIASDDDIIIDNGTYNITSKKSGIYAHDDITVNDGRLTVKGGTNGMKSKGTININGGYTVISGGTKEDKSSIYSDGAFSYTGGYVYAAGNKVTAPSYSGNPYVIVELSEIAGAGSNVEMLLNGQRMVSFEPHNEFRCLLMLAPEISSGNSFRANVNGYGNDFTISDGMNLLKMN